MRVTDFEEKRNFKRLDLSLPISVKRFPDDGKTKEKVQEGLTLNVSFNGAYVINIDVRGLKLGEKVNISLSVPREDVRDFPFSRILGKARVVRVETEGAAFEFSEDVSRLFVAE